MKNKRSLFAVPYVIWMALFVVIPIVIMLVYSLTVTEITVDGEAMRFSWENFTGMGVYASVFLRSFWLAVIATLVCLLIGYPVSYMMAREGAGFQRVAMALIMLPMWMNFLLRTYSWMSILENNGLLNQLFQSLGIIDLGNSFNGWLNGVCAAINSGPLRWINGHIANAHLALNAARPTDQTYFQMIRTPGAVVLGMVYNYLPFMILPIYSVLSKMDHSLVEAAQDLGANAAGVFRRVTLPLSLPGVLSGVTMVFVPSVSTFAISRLLGGGTSMMLGDLIENQFLGGAYNPHLGAAISMVMMVIVVVCMAVMNHFGEGEEQAVIL